jgi:uncharacterized protein YeaO (DUF488 family)
MHALQIKCAYEKPLKSDGFRIFVDKAWPQDLSKKESQIDLWLKEIDSNHNTLNTILALARKQPISLIYIEKDPAIALCIELQFQLLKQIH